MSLISRLFIIVAVVFFTIFLGVPTIHSVAIALVTTTFSSLSYYYANNNKFYLIYILVVACLISYNLDFLWLAILLVYDLPRYKLKYLTMISAAVLMVVSNPAIEAGASYLFWLLLSYLLALLNDQYLQTKKAKEHLEVKNLLALERLNKQNKALIASQDQQISYAKLSERGRIARDIHDGVGHLLSSSILQLGAIKALNQTKKLETMIDNLDFSLNAAMNAIRNSTFQMHASSIDLPEAINEVVLHYPDYHFDLYYDVKNEMASKLKITYLFIIKEAINNTIKHSNANKIKIIVRELTNHYQLIVQDNGQNINPHFQNGIGLMSIEERVNIYDGVLTIDVSSGFKLFISIAKEGEKCE